VPPARSRPVTAVVPESGQNGRAARTEHAEAFVTAAFVE
jgi:hypothetical protein